MLGKSVLVSKRRVQVIHSFTIMFRIHTRDVSFFRSIDCRRQNGLPIKSSMGICIQRMIDAEVAGIMFTRHPTTGDPSSILITANYGLGEVSRY